MDMQEMHKEILRISQESLRVARDTLQVNLRFLDMALSKFTLDREGQSFGTDGKNILYSPVHVIKRLKSDRNAMNHDYLHLVMHCVFQHMFVNGVDRRIWDLACDIAVESTVSELSLNCVKTANRTRTEAELAKLSTKVGSLTAERIYRFLLDEALTERQISALEEIFYADDHSLWYSYGSEGSSDGADNGSDGLFNKRTALANEWRQVSERMQEQMQTFEKAQGDRAGNLMQNLREINRERYDYTEFLKKFAVRTEVMKVNADEFDYVYYTYGLDLYGKMPLIEPLEYKDEKRIKDFVIAIDTSGSVQGELVQRFVQKTYNVMKSTESFWHRINVYIIQCDAGIQEAVKITSQTDFDGYLKNMKLKGFGGTDFRPVFRYVDSLIGKGELPNLKGLIYFTDGFGTFPERKPPYEAAFVFIEEDEYNKDIPSWAIRMFLKAEEI